ncbi:MAG: hypothetical protein KGO93_01835 [Cyanobacteria bacterium REEB446]|nr:hypothetical protein [Cyanobacteria bacterium REEB446]
MYKNIWENQSLNLDQKLGEPLTGRKKTFKLFTIAQLELNAYENPLESSANLDNRLVYGYYQVGKEVAFDEMGFIS